MSNGAAMIEMMEMEKSLHASKFGVSTDRVGVVQLELDALLSEGTLIDINVQGVSQFTTSVSFEELGIPAADLRAKRFTTGRKHLLPHKYISKLMSLDTRFRASLHRYSLDIEGFRPWRYLKATSIKGDSAYELWRAEWDKLQDELKATVEWVCTDWNAIRDELVSDFQGIADEAWGAIRARDGAFAEPRASFNERIVSKALAKLPTPDVIRATVRATYRTGFLLNQAGITAQTLHAQQLAQEVREKEIALTEQERKLRAMRQAELENARQQLESIASPFGEVMSKLKGQIFQDVQALQKILNERGYLPGRAVEKAKGLRELYNLMAIKSDDQLEAALNKLDDSMIPQNLKTDDGKRIKYDVASMSTALMEIAEQTKASINSISSQFSGWDALEVDAPTNGSSASGDTHVSKGWSALEL